MRNPVLLEKLLKEDKLDPNAEWPQDRPKIFGNDRIEADRLVYPLSIACVMSLLPAVIILIDNGADVENVWEDKTALIWACRAGLIAIVRYLVKEAGVDVFRKDRFGDNVLHHAAYFGHADIVRFLVTECKVPVNSRSDSGRTPLYDACWRGHYRTVSTLIELGADTRVLTKANESVLMAAVGGYKTRMPDYDRQKSITVMLLRDHQVDVNLVDKTGRNVLFYAAEFENTQDIPILLEFGATANQMAWVQDFDGTRHRRSVISHAMKTGNWKVIRLLVLHSKGTVSLRPKGSNHLMKPEEKLELLKDPRLLGWHVPFALQKAHRIFCNALDDKFYYGVGYTWEQCLYENTECRTLSLLWNCETARHFVMSNREHWHKLQDWMGFFGRKLLRNRISVLHCYQWADDMRGTPVKELKGRGKGLNTFCRSEIHDANLWRIILSFV